MTVLIDSILSATTPTAILVIGLLLMVGIVVLRINQTNKLVALADDLLNLAMDGRADEARIEARKFRAMRPLLEVLGGEVVAPRRRPMMKDAPWVLLIAVWVLGFVAYSLSVLGGDGETRIHHATALLLGIAILLPAGFATSIAIFEISRRATRSIRGTCIAVLAQNVKIAVDDDRKEAVRRGAKRDPRADE